MNISDFDHGKTKLDKINNYLQETFGFSLKKEDVTPEAIQNILYKVRDKQSEIVNESNINDFLSIFSRFFHRFFFITIFI
mgnify:CR=1 FL=1